MDALVVMDGELGNGYGGWSFAVSTTSETFLTTGPRECVRPVAPDISSAPHASRVSPKG